MPVQYIPRVFGGTVVITTTTPMTISTGDIYVRVLRAGVQVYPKIYMQRDNMSAQEASYYGGVGPYMRYALYPQGIYRIYQEDQLIDINNTDTKTKSGYVEYRVINDPEIFPDAHMEIVADRVRGR